MQLDGPSQCAAQVKEQVRTAGGKIGAFFMESGLSVGGVIIPPKRSDRPIFLRTADSVAFAPAGHAFAVLPSVCAIVGG